MSNTTRIQCTQRKRGEQWSVVVPAALAQALELMPGETVEWVIVDKDEIVLRRVDPTFPTVKKNTTTITRFF